MADIANLTLNEGMIAYVRLDRKLWSVEYLIFAVLGTTCSYASVLSAVIFSALNSQTFAKKIAVFYRSINILL